MKDGMSEEDWKRFDAITDEDIEKAMADDPDWKGIDLSDNRGWRTVYPDGSVVVPLVLDAKINNFLASHHLDYQSFLTGFLKSCMESEERI